LRHQLLRGNSSRHIAPGMFAGIAPIKTMQMNVGMP
jgi:hypothetical protein